MMTLGGLTVAIGRVVDDSIVVIENIFRHIQIGEKRNAELVRVATKEVSTAITSATLTTVAVFAPMAFVSGIVGEVFTPFAVSVALAVLASLLVSVTIVPLLSKWLLLGAKVKPVDEAQHQADSYYTNAAVVARVTRCRCWLSRRSCSSARWRSSRSSAWASCRHPRRTT